MFKGACYGLSATVSDLEKSYTEQLAFDEDCFTSGELNITPGKKYVVSASVDGYVIEPEEFTASLTSENVISLTAT